MLLKVFSGSGLRSGRLLPLQITGHGSLRFTLTGALRVACLAITYRIGHYTLKFSQQCASNYLTFAYIEPAVLPTICAGSRSNFQRTGGRLSNGYSSILLQFECQSLDRFTGRSNDHGTTAAVVSCRCLTVMNSSITITVYSDGTTYDTREVHATLPRL